MLVRKALLVSVITLSVLAYSSAAGTAAERSTSTAHERLAARQVAESVVKSFMAAYNTHDPKAISALFLPDAMLMGFNGPVAQGRETIERVYVGLLKTQGGHFTIIIKDAIPLGSNVVVATDELKISGVKNANVEQNSNKTINGRAVITLVKTPNGWRYISIAAQTLPPPGRMTVAGISGERSISTARERVALKVAQSVAKSYMAAFDTHDPKAISALFIPNGVFLPPNGSPVVQGREAIERAWAGTFKNVGGHETVAIKDAIPASNDAVVAITEFKIVGDGQNSNKIISGRASLTLAKTPDGWRYVSITAQTQPPPSGRTTGSRQ